MSAHPYDVLSLNNGANIIFTPCPGTKTQNLADSIATLKAAGTHMLLSLMPQKELKKNNVQTINSECNKHDITWFHLPINDDEAPKQPFTSRWNTHKTDILQAIQHKQTIATTHTLQRRYRPHRVGRCAYFKFGRLHKRRSIQPSTRHSP